MEVVNGLNQRKVYFIMRAQDGTEYATRDENICRQANTGHKAGHLIRAQYVMDHGTRWIITLNTENVKK